MRICIVALLLFLLYAGAAGAQSFSEGERRLILGGDTGSMMRVILATDPDEYRILTSTSTDISIADPLLPLLLRRMYAAMTDTANPGIGIAAPQVGINRNIIWLKRYDKEGAPFECYINPVITWSSGLMRKGSEGCLSIPDKRGDVLRHYTIRVRYSDLSGNVRDELVEGFTAVIFQHETDHLLGILFTRRQAEQASREWHPVSPVLDLYLDELPER